MGFTYQYVRVKRLRNEYRKEIYGMLKSWHHGMNGILEHKFPLFKVNGDL